MRVEIHSRYTLGDIKSKPFKYGIISVTEPSANFTHYPYLDPNLMGILSIKFSDITEEIRLKRGDNTIVFKPMSKVQARAILSFVSSIEADIEILLINCDAGISRSAAIAAGILHTRGQDDSHIWNDPLYLPNKYVYELLIEEYNNG